MASEVVGGVGGEGYSGGVMFSSPDRLCWGTPVRAMPVRLTGRLPMGILRSRKPRQTGETSDLTLHQECDRNKLCLPGDKRRSKPILVQPHVLYRGIYTHRPNAYGWIINQAYYFVVGQWVHLYSLRTAPMLDCLTTSVTVKRTRGFISAHWGLIQQ